MASLLPNLLPSLLPLQLHDKSIIGLLKSRIRATAFGVSSSTVAISTSSAATVPPPTSASITSTLSPTPASSSSHSQTIKVSISWKALVKLVDWFYSNVLPLPVSSYFWDNLDANEKLNELVYETVLSFCIVDMKHNCSELRDWKKVFSFESKGYSAA